MIGQGSPRNLLIHCVVLCFSDFAQLPLGFDEIIGEHLKEEEVLEGSDGPRYGTAGFTFCCYRRLLVKPYSLNCGGCGSLRIIDYWATFLRLMSEMIKVHAVR